MLNKSLKKKKTLCADDIYISVDCTQAKFGLKEVWHWPLRNQSVCTVTKLLVMHISDQDLLVMQGFTGEGA